LILARNVQKEFLIGESSMSHAIYHPTISGWLLVSDGIFYTCALHSRKWHVMSCSSSAELLVIT